MYLKPSLSIVVYCQFATDIYPLPLTSVCNQLIFHLLFYPLGDDWVLSTSPPPFPSPLSSSDCCHPRPSVDPRSSGLVVITCSKKAPERVGASTSSCRVFADHFKTPHTDKFVFSQESRNQKWIKIYPSLSPK